MYKKNIIFILLVFVVTISSYLISCYTGEQFVTNYPYPTVTVMVTDNPTPPIVKIVTPTSDNCYSIDRIDVVGTAIDDIAVHSIMIILDNNSTSIIDGSSTWNYISSTLQDGEHIITVYAIDSSNNLSQPEILSFNINNNIPLISIFMPDSSANVGSIFRIAGSADDLNLSSIIVSINSVGLIVSGSYNWETLTPPLTTGWYIINAVAIDSCGSLSTPAMLSVYVNQSLNCLTILSPANYSCSTTGTFSISGSAIDNNSITSVQVLIDSSPTIAIGTTSWNLTTPSLSDGNHTIRSIAYDSIGTSCISDTLTLIIDKTPPVFQIISPLNGSIVTSNLVNISGTASDPNFDHINADFNSNTLSITGSTNWNSSYFVVSGSYSISVTAFDRCGNISMTSIGIVVDAEPPSIAILSPSNNICFTTSSINVSGTAYDFIGLSSIEVSIDGSFTSFTGTNNWTINLTSIANGDHSIQANVYDIVGSKSASNIIIITVDNQNPLISITSPTNSAFLTSNTINITGSANDVNLDHISISVNAINLLATGTNNWSASQLVTSGTYNIIADAFDGCGNSTETSIQVIVDNQIPVISIISPTGNNCSISPTFTITGSAYDYIGIASIQIKVDNSPFQASGSNNWNYSSSLGSGIHSVCAIAYDFVGSMSLPSTITMINDNISPSCTINSPINNSCINVSYLSIVGSAWDNSALSSIQLIIDSSNIALLGADSWNYYVPSLTNGYHTIRARSFDSCTNSSSQSQVIIFIDTTTPTNSITVPVDGTCVGTGAFVASGTSSDTSYINTTVMVKVDAGAWQIATGTSNWTYNVTGLTSGAHSIAVKTFDQCSNTSSLDINTFFVMTSAPSSSILTPVNGTCMNTGSFPINATVFSSINVTTVAFIIDSASTNYIAGTNSWSYTPSLSTGNHSIKIQTKDQCGNIGAISTINITVCSTASTLTIISPTNCQAFDISSSSIDIFGSFSDLSSCVTAHTVAYSIDSGPFTNVTNSNISATTGYWTQNAITGSSIGYGEHTIYTRISNNTGSTVTSSPVRFYVGGIGQSWIGGGFSGWQTSSGTVPGSAYNSFFTPMGICVNGSDLYVAEYYNHRISKWNLTTGIASNWIGDGSNGWKTTSGGNFGSDYQSFYCPSDVCLAGSYLYIADSRNHRISRWDYTTGAAGGWIGGGVTGWNVSSGTSSGNNKSTFYEPGGVAVDTIGNILYIADTLNNRVSRWSLSGSSIGWIGDSSTGWKTSSGATASNSYQAFDSPIGITYTSNIIYVADRNNNRISRWYTPTGSASGWVGNNSDSWKVTSGANDFNTYQGFSWPCGVKVNNGFIYVVDQGNNRVVKWGETSGNALGAIGNDSDGWKRTYGVCPGNWNRGSRYRQFYLPTGIFVLSTSIYVSDTNNYRIVKWTD